jgi:hypothetical protein
MNLFDFYFQRIAKYMPDSSMLDHKSGAFITHWFHRGEHISLEWFVGRQSIVTHTPKIGKTHVTRHDYIQLALLKVNEIQRKML